MFFFAIGGLASPPQSIFVAANNAVASASSHLEQSELASPPQSIFVAANNAVASASSHLEQSELASPPQSIFVAANDAVASASALYAGKFSPSQYFNLDYSEDDHEGHHQENLTTEKPLPSEGDHLEQSELASPPQSIFVAANDAVASASALHAGKFLPSQYVYFDCSDNDHEGEGDHLERSEQVCVNPKDLEGSMACFGDGPDTQERDNLTDQPMLRKTRSVSSLSSMSEDGDVNPTSDSLGNGEEDTTIGVRTAPGLSESEEEYVRPKPSMQSSKALQYSRIEEERATLGGEEPPDSSDDEDYDPDIPTKSKDPLRSSSGDEDDANSESDLTAVGDDQPAQSMKLSLDSMAVYEGQPADFRKSLDGPTACIDEDEPMTGHESRKSPDGPASHVEEDDSVSDEEPKKSPDGPSARVREDDQMMEDESKKLSDEEYDPLKDDESKKSSDEEDGPLKDDEDDPMKDDESNKSSDEEDDPMGESGETLQDSNLSVDLAAPFEPRRSSRIAPMKKNPAVRIIIPVPRKPSKSKRKPAFSKGEVSFRVSVQLFYQTKIV